MLNYVFLFLLSLLVSQITIGQVSHPYLNNSIKVDAQNIPVAASTPYFPLAFFPEMTTSVKYSKKDSLALEEAKKKDFDEYLELHESLEGTLIFTPDKDLKDTFVVNWYSKHLHAMEEPLLFNKIINKEVYRFLWLRTFDPPIMVRIEKTGKQHYLYWKKCDGMGGYNPGDIIINKNKKLTKSQWNSFKCRFQKLNFWEAPIGIRSIGLDGAEWILEGVNQSQYKVLSKWSVGKGNYRNACMYLLKLTDLSIKNIY